MPKPSRPPTAIACPNPILVTPLADPGRKKIISKESRKAGERLGTKFDCPPHAVVAGIADPGQKKQISQAATDGEQRPGLAVTVSEHRPGFPSPFALSMRYGKARTPEIDLVLRLPVFYFPAFMRSLAIRFPALIPIIPAFLLSLAISAFRFFPAFESPASAPQAVTPVFGNPSSFWLLTSSFSRARPRLRPRYGCFPYSNPSPRLLLHGLTTFPRARRMVAAISWS